MASGISLDCYSTQLVVFVPISASVLLTIMLLNALR
jgi:hypothetical protein